MRSFPISPTLAALISSLDFSVSHSHLRLSLSVSLSSRPLYHSVMSSRFRSKTDFPKTPFAYRTDNVGIGKTMPPPVRHLGAHGRLQAAHGRNTDGRRRLVNLPRPSSN